MRAQCKDSPLVPMALQLRCLVAVFMHMFYSFRFYALCRSGGFFQPCGCVPSTPAFVLVGGL